MNRGKSGTIGDRAFAENDLFNELWSVLWQNDEFDEDRASEACERVLKALSQMLAIALQQRLPLPSP